MADQTSQSFEECILPHLDSAYNLARWLTRDRAVAEDIVQDACVRALQYFASHRGEDSRAWLLRIVRNTAFSRFKQERRRGIYLVWDTSGDSWSSVADPEAGPEATVALRQEYASVEAALLALPPNLRECLILRNLEELSYQEIAVITAVPVGTVMSRLFRARERLAKSTAPRAANLDDLQMARRA
jgi:RNA polymerase sigma-70 factor (ECF subfamily)